MLNEVPEPVAPDVPVTLSECVCDVLVGELVVPLYVCVWSTEAFPAVAVIPVVALTIFPVTV